MRRILGRSRWASRCWLHRQAQAAHAHAAGRGRCTSTPATPTAGRARARRPTTQSGKAFGLDFMGGSEHSDNADLPLVASEYCIDPLVAPQCALADPVNPLDSFRKWDATLEQARAASTPTFTAFRGFEWTSDRFGHINVYFSQHDANAKADGGYATMDAFYSWLTRAPSLGGGGGRARDLQPSRREVAGRPRPGLQLERLRLRAGRGRPHGRDRGLQRQRRLRGMRYPHARSTRAGTWARSAPRTSATGAPTTGAVPAGPRP